jgi:ankyrin repeat protein
MKIDDAIRGQDLEAVKQALSQKPSPKQLDKALERAFWSKPPLLEAMTLVTEAGATPDGLGRALRQAAGKGLAEHVERLLQLGAPVAGGGHGGSPINRAAERGHTATVQQLIEAGAEISPRYDAPLALAAEKGHLETVRALLAAGADPDCLGGESSSYRDGRHALVNAIHEGHLEIVRALLEAGTNLAFATKRHRTPLEIARSTEGREEITALLEEAKAPEVAAEMLELAGAAERGFGERAAGLFAEASEREQRKAIEGAIKAGHGEVAKALAAVASDELRVLGLCVAAGEGNLELIAHFLDQGAQINALPGRDYPALLYAARRNQLEAARLLLDRGANPDTGDYRNETPLHIAAERNHLEMVKVLLDGGANLKAKCNSGRTPTRVAKEYNAQDTHAYLKQRAKPRSKRKVLTDAKGKLAGRARLAHKPKTSKRKKLALAESRLGGYPALLEGEPWPQGKSGEPLRFLLQLDVAILPEDVLGGGMAGLVQLFFNDQTNEHLARVLPSGSALVAGELPSNVEEVGPRLTITGWLKPKEDWPQADSVGEVTLDAEEREAIAKLNLAGDKAGGWPHWIQGGGSSTSADGRPLDRLLLQLDAGGALPFIFGDNGIAFLLATSSEPLAVSFEWQSP